LPRRFERGDHGVLPLLVQADLLLDLLFFVCVLFLCFIGVLLIFIQQPLHRRPRQAAEVFQVAIDDLLLGRMRRQPRFAVTEQLFHFVIPDPVMLVVVEHGDEHVQMPQQLLKRNRLRKLDGEIRAIAPVRELIIQYMPRRRDLISEWLE